MNRNTRLTGSGKSPLLQFWTTLRFRVFLRMASAKLQVSQSEFARRAIWSAIEATLTGSEAKRAERQAEEEAAAERKKPR